MPKIYIKSIANNISNYYLNLIIKNLTDRLNSNSIKYQIIESIDKYLNNKSEEILLGFELNNQKNADSQGISIYISQSDPNSNRLANCISKNINKILNTKIINLSNKQNNYIPNVMINFGNLNSEKDIKNLRDNIENITQEIILSLDEYFGIPFVPNTQNNTGFSASDINIYTKPNLNSKILGNIIPSEKINIIGQWEDWYIINQNNNLGYIQTKNIQILDCEVL